MELVRINKYLAQIGVASRREIDRLVLNGSIKINGKIATQGEKVSDKDEIVINGRVVKKESNQKKYYFLLNKPKGVLSSAKDDRGRKTVVDMIPCEGRLYPVGRLDLDTEGAIILTNDGDVYNKIIHPKGEVFKEYYAIIKGEIKDKDLSKLSKGIILEDGVTLPSRTKIIKRDKGKSEVSISIREGKNRQVRRMFEAVKHPVVYLRRESVGKIKLDKLEIGSYRRLTSKEIDYLKSL